MLGLLKNEISENSNCYKIVDILHSGRKDIRGKPVTDKKYEGLINSKIICDLKNIKPFERVRMYVKNHPLYDYWDISAVVKLSYDELNKIWIIETLNSIYKLKELGTVVLD
jgi:ribosomal protein L14E/L6E/L27E